jgi:hypothetical protein
MAQLDDALQLVADLIETNGEQAGRAAQALSTVVGMQERAADLYRDGAEQIRQCEQGAAYIRSIGAKLASLGTDMEEAQAFLQALDE